MEWEKFVSGSKEAQRMGRLFKGYSYADKPESIATDGKVCGQVVDGIRQAKGTLFNIIELLYEVEKKEPKSSGVQKLKDELDIFSDEIKVRHCEWKELDEKWMAKLVEHDLDLVEGMKRMNEDLQALYEKVLASKALLSESEEVDERIWAPIKNALLDTEKQLDKLVILFKEREGICNLKPLALEKTYEKIQERIGKQI